MDDVARTIGRLEAQLLDPAVRTSPSRLGALLHDDFIEFGASGRVYTKQLVLDTVPAEAPRALRMHEFSATVLAPGVVLATYRLHADGEPDSLRSSIWTQCDGAWLVLFHQGTPLH